jgi:ribosomal protein S18 acetylase RimI-like enzyme
MPHSAMDRGAIQLVAADHHALDAVLPLVEAFYAHFGYAFEAPRKRELLGGLLGDPAAGRLWLIHDGERPIGYLLLAFSFSLEMDGRIAFVDELYIAPEGRSRGAGARALALAEEACRGLGIRVVRLEAEADNTRAAALYVRQGYIDLGRRLLSKPLGSGDIPGVPIDA